MKVGIEMTEKERLEETNKLESIRNSLESLELCEILFFIDKQAERAQELEEHLEKNRDYLYKCNTLNERLERQNKRYREIIQDFIDYADDYNIAKAEKYRLRKALEG